MYEHACHKPFGQVLHFTAAFLKCCGYLASTAANAAPPPHPATNVTLLQTRQHTLMRRMIQFYSNEIRGRLKIVPEKTTKLW